MMINFATQSTPHGNIGVLVSCHQEHCGEYYGVTCKSGCSNYL